MSDNCDMAYGCIFCITGKEENLARRIERACPCVQAIVARQEKFKSVCGRKSKVTVVALAGYVFFKAPRDIRPSACFPKEAVIRLLITREGEWQLQGEDKRFAEWLFEYGGLLRFSTAHREGERIRIISGPLKSMEGQIKKIDKRGHSGQIVLEFNGKSVPIWLGFDLLGETED